MSPRISFSNDFAESRHERTAAAATAAAATPASSDFEFFPVANCSSTMSGADELFFKGRLLPYKDSGCPKTTTTLRDELLAGEDGDGDGVAQGRPPKGSKWKGFLGLRKSHIGSKKPDKITDGPPERSLAAAAAAQGKKYPPFFHEDAQVQKRGKLF